MHEHSNCSWLLAAWVIALAGCSSPPTSTAASDGSSPDAVATPDHASINDSAPEASSADSSHDVSIPDVTPVSCTLTGAPVGTWQPVAPPEFLNPSNLETWSVALNPQDESVFAAAGNITNGCGGATQPACIATGVYKSTDCGGTWHLVSTGRSHTELATGDPWAMRIDPINPQNMYINNGYGSNPTLFKSTNGGVDWDPLAPDPGNLLQNSNTFVQAVALDRDPSRSGHLVVTFHEDCTGNANPLCLAETTDGGATWREFSGPEIRDSNGHLIGWEESAAVTILGATSYLLTVPQGWGGYFTSNGGQSWSKVFDGPAYGDYGGGGEFGPDGTVYVGVENTGIFYSSPATSSPLGATWTLIQGSPSTFLVIDDGTNLYAATNSQPNPYWFAPLNQLTATPGPTWTNMNTNGTVHGAGMFAYDSVHHIVYAAAQTAGILRLVTH